jgi:AraC-like DNA-binding protein
MQYLLEWRVALAKDLLRTERPSIAQVAQRVGYQSATAFTTAFTRVAGCSPTDFARAASSSRQDVTLAGGIVPSSSAV